jgi:hypothetical protein
MTAEQIKQFAELFRGRTDAFGTGAGRWVRKPVSLGHYEAHLRGLADGLGIAPLTDDNKIRFAAIDLDEPDFESAREMQSYLPGPSFVERSRSGNSHVWVFFEEPVEAWPVRGILKDATLAAGKANVEVFPKQDRLYPELRSEHRPELGNYLNLPFHGDKRPMLDDNNNPWSLQTFLATVELNVPEAWRKRAEWLQVPSPEERSSNRAEFGGQKVLHICAEHIVANRESNPVLEGSRNVVYFSLSKMLLNYEGFDEDEAWHLVQLVNDSSPDRMEEHELRRIFNNASVKQMTSTGCDDALVMPYTHPDCPIARRAR